MSNPNTTIWAETFVWNAITWSADVGGLVRVRWSLRFQERADAAGADVYSRQIFLTGGRLEVRVALRDLTSLSIGTKSNASATYKTKGSPKTRNFVGLIFMGIETSQDKDNLGEEEAVFVSESTDGVTVPVS
ncbi:MAG: hypothetical protein KIS92_00850 [Planctomycetota bacterium]|nr:hypothetical protein [Planctomycetota bacterium]